MASIQENNKMSINNLFSDIVNKTNNQRYCFILGAGASRESGIRTGVELARIWLNEIEDLDDDCRKLYEKDLGRYYSEIYDMRFSNIEQGYARLQKEMNGITPSCGYYYLSRILTETDNNLIITTNFDSLMEDSIFVFTNKKPLVINHESLADHLKLVTDRPIIAKIHGDVLLQPLSSKNDMKKLGG
jgi:hypothetical protein